MPKEQYTAKTTMKQNSLPKLKYRVAKLFHLRNTKKLLPMEETSQCSLFSSCSISTSKICVSEFFRNAASTIYEETLLQGMWQHPVIKYIKASVRTFTQSGISSKDYECSYINSSQILLTNLHQKQET